MRLPFCIGGLLKATGGDYGQHYRENEQERNFYIQHTGTVPVQLRYSHSNSELPISVNCDFLRSFFLVSAWQMVIFNIQCLCFRCVAGKIMVGLGGFPSMINFWVWPSKIKAEWCEARLWYICLSLYWEDKPCILTNLVEVPSPIIWLCCMMTVGKGSG